MELQQLRYVVAVTELRNFTRAAEHCHVVQSALSHQVAGLEKELGVRLFLRTNRRVDVTPAGAAFVQVAREILAGVDRARSAAIAAAGELTGRLVVGSIPNLTALDVPRALRAFRDRHPQVDLQVVSRRSEDMYQGVVERSIDIAFIGSPIGATRHGVADHQLSRERLELVVSPDHALVDRHRLRLVDLAGEDFVDFPAGSHARTESDAAFEQADVSRRVCVEVDNTDAFRSAVAAGLGIGMLPRDPVGTGVDAGIDAPLVRIPVQDAPWRSQHVLWAKPPSPAALALIDELQLRAGHTRTASGR
jgi:DNA-binding transcriptional LysR family regulator